MAGKALPKTKDQLKEKNLKLRKELDNLRRQYGECVYSVIEKLRRQYNRTKMDPTLCYERLKQIIKEATSDESLEQSGVVPGKVSVPIRHGLAGLRKNTKEVTELMRNNAQHEREVSNMHKAQIEVQNEQLIRHIQRYDTRFKQAHNKLRTLRREYTESKQYLPHKRYRLLKEMIKTVIKDSELTPD